MARVLSWIAVLLVFGAGFLIGGWRSEPTRVVETQDSPELLELQKRYLDAQRRFGELAETDYADYLRLKISEEKFRKADEILGKIMLVLVADLGLRISPRPAGTPESQPSPSPSPSISPSPSPSPSQKPTPRPESGSSRASDAEEACRWRRDEYRFYSAYSEPALQAALKSVRLTPLPEAFEKLRPIGKIAGQEAQSAGCFQGEVSFRARAERKSWTVRWQYAVRSDSMELSPASAIAILEDGKLVQHVSASADPTVFGRPACAESAALLVRPTQNDVLQLYFVKQWDAFAANLYHGVGAGFEWVGSFRLNRQTPCSLF